MHRSWQDYGDKSMVYPASPAGLVLRSRLLASNPTVMSTASQSPEGLFSPFFELTQNATHRPLIGTSHCGYRAPSTLMFEEALSMARRSSGVSSRFAAPRFSSRRCSLVVPGIGTIHGLLAAAKQARAEQ